MLGIQNIDYKVKRQTSRLWRTLLTATSSEIANSVPEDQLRTTMIRIGEKFAKQTTLPDEGSIRDYEQYMCSVWADMDWGWVELKDSGSNLVITHHSSTNGRLNNSAFGDFTEAWVPSFLEGVYQHWMSSIGAGEKLKVKLVGNTDEFGSIEYCLGI